MRLNYFMVFIILADIFRIDAQIQFSAAFLHRIKQSNHQINLPQKIDDEFNDNYHIVDAFAVIVTCLLMYRRYHAVPEENDTLLSRILSKIMTTNYNNILLVIDYVAIIVKVFIAKKIIIYITSLYKKYHKV